MASDHLGPLIHCVLARQRLPPASWHVSQYPSMPRRSGLAMPIRAPICRSILKSLPLKASIAPLNNAVHSSWRASYTSHGVVSALQWPRVSERRLYSPLVIDNHADPLGMHASRLAPTWLCQLRRSLPGYTAPPPHAQRTSIEKSPSSASSDEP